MAVKPYWWCPNCQTTHDAKANVCINCGRVGLARKEARVASALPLYGFDPPLVYNRELLDQLQAVNPGAIGKTPFARVTPKADLDRLDRLEREMEAADKDLRAALDRAFWGERKATPPPRDPVAIAADWHATSVRAAEQGAGIAALSLKIPPRPRPARHETKAWDPYGVTLPDAESGRYGWLS